MNFVIFCLFWPNKVHLKAKNSHLLTLVFLVWFFHILVDKTNIKLLFEWAIVAIFCYQLFCQKIFRKLSYELSKRILILKTSDDFFWIFKKTFEKFWMIPYDKYTWEGQIFILRFITCLLQMKSTIKPNFSKFELWWKSNLMTSP